MPNHRDTPYPPLSDYALLSDCHGSALVSRGGSVDWCCLPRFDARPVFSRLLDWERGGHFLIAPAGEHETTRRYLPGTNVLETRFRTATGTMLLTDFMAIAQIDPESDPELEEPAARAEDRLVRMMRVEEGEVEVRIEYRPRFDFGAIVPHTSRVDDDLLSTYGGADALVLQTPIPLEVEGADAAGSVVLDAGEERSLVLSYHLPHKLEPARLDASDVRSSLETTSRYWETWSSRCAEDIPYRDAVVRSALVLKALTNLPTGAIVAAPTTSLPEEIGGVRNWDYRYAWLRDAAYAVDGLFRLGYPDEAGAFLRWLHRTTAGRPEQLQIMYAVAGERLLTEVEIPHLEGYRGSAPVRIGNAAAAQFQLDIFGDLLLVAWRQHEHGEALDDDVWDVVRGMVDHVCEVWEDPDHGLWEVRTEPRHFTHSKVMAWVAVDRGIRLAEARECFGPIGRWDATRSEIRRRVMDEGRDEEGRFRRVFEASGPDAANLLLPVLGFLAFDDPAIEATRGWIVEALSRDGLVYRYLGADGLPGSEGAFVACGFWLVEHLARAGETERARRIFERNLEFRNDVGLLPEEINPEDGTFLGNFPQGLSHIGLIQAALSLRAG